MYLDGGRGMASGMQTTIFSLLIFLTKADDHFTTAGQLSPPMGEWELSRACSAGRSAPDG